MQILVYGISNQKGGISEFMMNLNKNMLNKDISFNYIINGKESVYAPLIHKMNGKVFYYNYRNKIERLTNLYKIMKKERLLNAIGQIDEKLIADAFEADILPMLDIYRQIALVVLEQNKEE